MTCTTEHARQRPARTKRAGALVVGVAAALVLGVAGPADAAGYTYAARNLPLTFAPDAIAVDQGTGDVYVNDNDKQPGRLVRVDPRSGEITGEVDLPGGVGGIVVDSRTHRVYVDTGNAAGTGAAISVIDPTTFTTVGTFEVPSGAPMLVGASGDLYFATTGDSVHSAIQIIDTTTYQTKATVPIDYPSVTRVSEDPTSHTLWVESQTYAAYEDQTHARKLRLDVVDTQTARVTGTIGPFAISPDFPVGDFALDPTRQLAYVSGTSTTSPTTIEVAVYSMTTRARVDTITGPFGPGQLAIDPSNQTLYATGFFSPTTVIDLVSRRITATVPTGVAFRRSTIDTRTHTLYGLSYDLPQTITAITQTGSPAAPPSCTGVIGAIGAKYTELGGCTSYLGQPTSTEQDAAGGGNVTHFEHGDIYYSPTTGAHAITGAIQARWLTQGGPASRLGYPTSDEYGALFGRVSHFQHGFIYFNPLTGAIPIIF